MTERASTWALLPALLLVFAAGCFHAVDNAEPSPDSHNTGDDDGDGAVDPEDCESCHMVQAARWENDPSSHREIFRCADCHEATRSTPGLGHRNRPMCESCHSETTHVPTYFADGNFRLMSCRTCHNPHGTRNLMLIRESVLIGDTSFAPIEFTNLEGMGDGGFVGSGPLAGTGLCEVCHIATRYYNRFANGETHYTSRCTDCHGHETGFARP